MKKNLLLAFVLMLLISCGSNSNRYIKIAESERVEPKYNEKYGVIKQEVVVILDSKKNDFIYYDVWGEKIISRIPIK